MLLHGERLRWNRIAALVAWAVFHVCSVIPKFSKRSDWRSECRTLGGFLSQRPPPGYNPLPEKKVRRRVIATGRKGRR